MIKLASGQVYDIYSNGIKVGRVTLDRLKETTSQGDEMWTTVGGGGSTFNVVWHIKKCVWRMYSQHPLNGGK